MNGPEVARGEGGPRARRTKAGIPERRECAFGAYLDVLETAAWFRYQVEPQLADFGLNLERFRVLETLYREGPMTTVELGKRRCCARQTLFGLAGRLATDGLVEIERETLAPAEIPEAKLRKEKRGGGRVGRRMATVRLTAEGEKLMAEVRRRHAKLVYALMRALDMREAERLSRMCQKIREGDPLRLIKELIMEDVD